MCDSVRIRVAFLFMCAQGSLCGSPCVQVRAWWAFALECCMSKELSGPMPPASQQARNQNNTDSKSPNYTLDLAGPSLHRALAVARVILLPHIAQGDAFARAFGAV